MYYAVQKKIDSEKNGNLISPSNKRNLFYIFLTIYTVIFWPFFRWSKW